MFRLKIDEEVSSRYPQYGCVVAYALGISNLPSAQLSEEFKAEIAEVAAAVRRSFETSEPASHPHIASWRSVFQSFGAKQQRELCGVEALVMQILKKGSLRDANPAVNAYNLVSLQHMLPVGGEDWSRLASDNLLCFSSGSAPFEAMDHGELVVEMPRAGEVVWADAEGVTCRKWNWRQCHRTQIVETTTAAYFVFDVLAPYDIAIASAAAENLRKRLSAFSPDLSWTTETLKTPGAWASTISRGRPQFTP
jgi:DNA/RNA-binding domain of Phe-tRNA-synthetase-like protein